MSEPWEQLKVGDRVRIVRLPGQAIPGYYMHEETRQLYERLIERGRSVRVYEIDKDGLPWIRCKFWEDGGWDHHYLAINEDSWVLVKPRSGRYPSNHKGDNERRRKSKKRRRS